MKYFYIITIVVFLFSFQVKGQQLMLEGGKSLTTITFKNSQGENLENLQATTQNYISVAFRKNAVKDILHVIAGTGINSYGAIGSDNAVNNFFEWETTYLSLFTGVDIKMFKANKFSFYLRGTVSSEFILQGSQTLNNQVFNLVGEEDFNKTNFFFRGGLVSEYSLSESVSIFLQYKYGQSKQLRYESSNINQSKTRLRAHDIGFGLVINLEKKKNEALSN